MWKSSLTCPRLEVSKCGRVRKWNRSWGRYVENKKRLDKDGYETIGYRTADGKLTTARVHRLVAEAYVPNPDNKPVVNHLNGVKNDNRADNLVWSTVAENTQHAYDKLGVISAASVGVTLYVDGEPFSTYDSKQKATNSLGIWRGALDNIVRLSEGYINYSEELFSDSEFPHNREFWKSGRKLVLGGDYYIVGNNVFDSIDRVSDFLGVAKLEVQKALKYGSVGKVSCKEFMRNSNDVNW